MDRSRGRRSLGNVLVVLAGLLAVRMIVAALLPRLGLPDVALFVTPDDRFGDSLKAALAETGVTAPLWHDPRVASWPPLIQKYLFANDYLGPGTTIRHLPPLSTLLLMAFGALFFIMPPVGVIGTLLAAYAAGSLAVARMVERLSQQPVLLSAFLLILLSYPALFMMDRGNLHSGYTSLLVIAYVFTVIHRRFRWLGFAALVIAANIRPNVALLALLELCREGPWRALVRTYAGMALAGCAVGLTALWLAGLLDPAYTLPEFLRSYAWYQRDYVEGPDGMGWNLSLVNVAKLVNAVTGHRPLYDPLAGVVISVAGLGLTLAFVGLQLRGRLVPQHFVFALTALCTVFTPVFAEYHAVIFVAPLLLLALGHRGSFGPGDLWRGGGLLLVLQLAGLAAELAQGAIGLALLALAFPWVAAHLSGSVERRADTVLLLASMAALAPLGGATSNGLALALLLAATLVWLALYALRHGQSQDNEQEPQWT